jgi:atypical dual specificity phosphatase
LTDLDLLLPNFGWVVPGVLAGCGLPGRGLASKVSGAYALARAQGVDLVVSLLEAPPPLPLLQAARLGALHFPIPDHGAPDDLPAFARFVDAVAVRIEAGETTLVHCYAGIGRTGLFLAAWLARHRGMSAELAISTLRAVRPRSIETAVQIRALAQLAPP